MTLLFFSILFFYEFLPRFLDLGKTERVNLLRVRACVLRCFLTYIHQAWTKIKPGRLSSFSLHSYNVFPHHSSNYWSPGKTCSQAEALEGILRRGLSWVLQSKHHISPRRAHLVYLVQKCCHLESEFNKNGCKSLFLRSLKQTGLWVEVKRSWYISDFLNFFLYFVI